MGSMDSRDHHNLEDTCSLHRLLSILRLPFKPHPRVRLHPKRLVDLQVRVQRRTLPN